MCIGITEPGPRPSITFELNMNASYTITMTPAEGLILMIYAEDNPSGYYDAFEVTVISDEPVKPVPYRNGVSVSDHRKVDDLGNGKYRMYVDPELWNQYYFMVEPMAGYHIEYREAKGEIVDKGLHGGTIRVMKIPQTGDRSNIFAYAVFGLIAMAGILVLMKRQ